MDGTGVNVMTSKWNSLHFIFIFLKDGEMMSIMYASCIAKRGTDRLCFVNRYKPIADGFYLRRIWEGILSGELLLIYIFECK